MAVFTACFASLIFNILFHYNVNSGHFRGWAESHQEINHSSNLTLSDGLSKQEALDTSNLSNKSAASAIKSLADPQTAANRLQDPSWIKPLEYIVTAGGAGNRRRIVEWKVKPQTNQTRSGVELLLMPFQYRSSLLIDLFLNGKVSATMGENVVMIGWAKACLALGCDRVLMFDSYKDFVDSLDTESNQFYILDYNSLPALKDDLLLNPILNQRTWEFFWWGRTPRSIKEKLNITERYNYSADHALLPFNFTNGPKENIRMAILPSAVTMNHVPQEEDDPIEPCDAFFMGKSVENIENSTAVMKLVESILSKTNVSVESVRLCTAFKIPDDSSYEEVLGFVPKYIVNVGRMKPTQFAATLGNAKGWFLDSLARYLWLTMLSNVLPC